MAAGVLSCGNMVLDILVRPVDQIRFDTTTWVQDIVQHLGGNGANTSYTLARLGVRARLCGVMGQDAFGDLVFARLTSAGVDTTLVSRIDAPTPTTVGLVQSNGSRAFLHRPGSSADAFTEVPEFTDQFIDGCRAFHLANPFALPSMRSHAGEMVKRARSAGLRTSLDTGWDAREEWMKVVGPCLPYVDYFFANDEETRMLTNAPDSEAAAAALLSQGVGTVVVKLGAAGCAVYKRDLELRVPGFSVEAIDTTGAGDCFAGGFLAGLEHGATLEGCARLANACGALSVTRLGATEGILSYNETLEWIATRTDASSIPGTSLDA